MIKTKKKLLLIIFCLTIFFLNLISAQTCSGTVHICNNHNGDQNACTSAGCSYNTNQNKCVGSHNICSSYSSQSTCESHSCTWDPGTSNNNSSGSSGSTNTIIVQDGVGFQNVLGIFPRNPLGGDSIEYGYVELKVEVFFGGEETNSATIKATSPLFGETILTHKSTDPKGIYTSKIKIDDKVESGPYRIVFSGKLGGEFNEAYTIINLKHSLDIDAKIIGETIKGSDMIISGRVIENLGNYSANASISLTAEKEGIKIFEFQTTTNSTGGFIISYPLKYSDPEGSWHIILKAISTEGKVGITKLYSVIKFPPNTDYLNVLFQSPLKDDTYNRGEIIPITIQVKDGKDILVNKASVKVYTPNGEEIILKEDGEGIYSGEYIIKPNDELGDWFLRSEVSKDEIRKVGGATLSIKVSSAIISLNMISPEGDTAYTNQKIKIKINPTYPSGEKVRGANALIKLSNEDVISLFETDDGIYEGQYFLGTDNTGTLDLQIEIEDNNQNIGSLSKSLFIKKRDMLSNILAYIKNIIIDYWWAFSIVIIILGYIYKDKIIYSSSNFMISQSKKKEKEIKAMQIETEKQYYKFGKLKKNEFDAIMESYDERLAKEKEKQNFYRDKIK